MRHLALPVLVAVAALASCSSTATPKNPHDSTPVPDPTVDLSNVCPSTAVIQTDWQPEATHGAVYELLGPGYTINANQKRVTGPLMIDGKRTGVRAEIRAGGSSIGFQTIPAQMYVDRTITLGFVTTDAAISAASTQPVTAVVSPLNKSPQMLMWDPASHPTWNSIADIGHSKRHRRRLQGRGLHRIAGEKGLVRAKQIDTSYDGSPARFVANPSILQQGFTTAEPYIYEHEVPAWNKPVKYQLLSDVGYDVYPQALSVRTRDMTTLSPCLTKLVPIIQKAQANYLDNPATANNTILSAVKKYNDEWTYSSGIANHAVRTMKELHLVATDTVGGMNLTRVQSAIDTFTPTLQAGGATVKTGLKAADIATDRFIDKNISMK
ncbi:hypothetical protein ACFYPT_40215 [Streptomyces sp. NPDC005529]|uniref:hypothetical protein n=1 Tax=unclassified Streptomyces TaxID=2593676 RepID=UPI0033BB1D80